MIKYELEKLKGTSNYFPKIRITESEFDQMYLSGQIAPSFLRQFIVNEELESWIRTKKPLRLSKHDGYERCLQIDPVAVETDLTAYLSGDIDRMDLIVRYGVDYKQLKTFFRDMLGEDAVQNWNTRKAISQKATTQDLYGLDHTAQLQEVKDKKKATTITRYGVENVMQLPEYRAKYRDTMQTKYGVDHNFQLSEPSQNWKKNTYALLTQDHRWQELLGTFEEFTRQYPLTRRDFIITECDNDHVYNLLQAWMSKYGPIKYPNNQLFSLRFDQSKTWLKHYDDLGLITVDSSLYNAQSQYEVLVNEKLQELGVPYVRNHRKLLDGLEIDFYLPEHQLGIEVNPNSTHNSNRYANQRAYHQVKEDDYHFNKYLKAKEKGITLIQLFSFDLEPRQFATITWPRIQSQIVGYQQRYYARQTIIKPISTKDAYAFCERYHTQGYVKSSVKYGMFYDNECVAVATFGSMRNGAMELKRCVYKPSVQIVGATSKFIHRYFQDHTDDEIFSYSDNNYGTGNSYQASGATFLKETGPSCVFISPTDPQDRYSWQVATPWSAKQGIIAKDFGDVYTGDIDEYVETTLSHRTNTGRGYDRIYTAGSKLWKFERGNFHV